MAEPRTLEARFDSFLLFLESELPLFSYDTDVSVTVHEGVAALEIATTLDRGSAEDLEDSKLFPHFTLPDRVPLAELEVRLELTARRPLLERLTRAVAAGRPALEVLVERPDNEVTPYRRIDGYELRRFRVDQSLEVSRELSDLAAKKPAPLPDDNES